MSAWINPASTEPMAILSKMDDDHAYRGYDFILEQQGRLAAHIIHTHPDNFLKVVTKEPLSPGAWHHVAVTYDGSSKAAGVKMYVDGQPQQVTVEADKLSDTIVTDQPLHVGRRSHSLSFNGKIDDLQIYRQALAPENVRHLAAAEPVVMLASILQTSADERSAAQKQQLRRAYLETADGEYRRLKAELADLSARSAAVESATPVMMVMQEMPTPRQPHILLRGQYDHPGEVVAPAVPAFLPPMPAGAPPNRLGLAQWLVDPANPLTARVAVNRLWEQIFGVGLVKTAEDFGVQGEPPSHPELLDWLASEFVRTGWDVKAMMKLIVTSSAYCQSSDSTPDARQIDPENRLLRAARACACRQRCCATAHWPRAAF